MLNRINEIFGAFEIITEEQKMEGIKKDTPPIVREAKRIYWLIMACRKVVAGDMSPAEHMTFKNDPKEAREVYFFSAVWEYKLHFLPHYLMWKGEILFHPYCLQCVMCDTHSIHSININAAKEDHFATVRDAMKKFEASEVANHAR